MDLENFIAQSLESIVNGIKKAEKKFNPSLDGVVFSFFEGSQKDNPISFDVAVIAEDKRSTEKGGEARIKVLGGGISKTDSVLNQTSSRIKFQVYFGNKIWKIQK